MTGSKGKAGTIDVTALLAEDEEFVRALVRTALPEVPEAEMARRWAPRRASGRRGGRDIGRAITAGG